MVGKMAHDVASGRARKTWCLGTYETITIHGCIYDALGGAYLISGTGRDGTGRSRKIRLPNFRDDGTITEILTYLNPGIT